MALALIAIAIAGVATLSVTTSRLAGLAVARDAQVVAVQQVMEGVRRAGANPPPIGADTVWRGPGGAGVVRVVSRVGPRLHEVLVKTGPYGSAGPLEIVTRLYDEPE